MLLPGVVMCLQAREDEFEDDDPEAGLRLPSAGTMQLRALANSPGATLIGSTHMTSCWVRCQLLPAVLQLPGAASFGLGCVPHTACNPAAAVHISLWRCECRPQRDTGGPKVA